MIKLVCTADSTCTNAKVNVDGKVTDVDVGNGEASVGNRFEYTYESSVIAIGSLVDTGYKGTCTYGTVTTVSYTHLTLPTILRV